LGHCRGLKYPPAVIPLAHRIMGQRTKLLQSKLRRLAGVAFDLTSHLDQTSVGLRSDLNLAGGGRGLSSRTFLTERIVSRLVSRTPR